MPVSAVPHSHAIQCSQLSWFLPQASHYWDWGEFLKAPLWEWRNNISISTSILKKSKFLTLVAAERNLKMWPKCPPRAQKPESKGNVPDISFCDISWFVMIFWRPDSSFLAWGWPLCLSLHFPQIFTRKDNLATSNKMFVGNGVQSDAKMREQSVWFPTQSPKHRAAERNPHEFQRLLHCFTSLVFGNWLQRASNRSLYFLMSCG